LARATTGKGGDVGREVPIFDYPVISVEAGEEGILELGAGATVETEKVYRATDGDFGYDPDGPVIATVELEWTPTKGDEWELISATFQVPPQNEEVTVRHMVKLDGSTRKGDGGKKHGGGKLGVSAATGWFEGHHEPVFLRVQNPKRWSIEGP
jgi:hypothetical protein